MMQSLRRALVTTSVLLTSGIVVACASPGLPPGGPPDPETPIIVRITPDTNAVNVQAKSAVIHFDEVISEQPGSGSSGSSRAGAGGGVAGGGLASIVSISPTDGRDQVTWRRTAIEITPRRGFRPNTAYRVTILPGVSDLRGNSVSVATEWVFSTGPTIPVGEVSGAVFDYGAAKPVPNARVEVYFPADSVLRWGARADSSGRFTVRDLTPGTYTVRAFIDANNDRQLGEREAYDTSTVTIDTRGAVDLYAFVRDTMPPRIEQVEFVDSTALRVRFDRAIVGDWDPTGAVKLFTADSVEIALGGELVPSARYDSLARAAGVAAKKAAADSLTADSLSADSVVARRTPDEVERPVVDTTKVLTAAARDSLASDSLAAADTVVVIPPPTFRRVVPITHWTVRLAAPLTPGVYKLRVTGAPGLNGARSDSEREVRVRPPEPPKAATDPTATPATIPPGLPPTAAPVTPPVSNPPATSGTRRPR